MPLNQVSKTFRSLAVELIEPLLFKAHYNARKAESYLKSNEIELSLKFLDKCIECLDQSLNVTTSPKAIESIKLQRNHHIKQRDLIQNHYKKIEKQKQEEESVNAQLNERVINSNKIQLDLFENIDNTDTLLEDLKKIMPDQSTAAELQQMNSQLNVLLFQLITQLDETIQENDLLKQKIKSLETETKARCIEKREEEVSLRESPEATEADMEFAPLDLPVFDLELDSLANSKD